MFHFQNLSFAFMALLLSANTFSKIKFSHFFTVKPLTYGIIVIEYPVWCTVKGIDISIRDTLGTINTVRSLL